MVKDSGICPVTKEPLSMDDIVPVKMNKVISDINQAAMMEELYTFCMYRLDIFG